MNRRRFSNVSQLVHDLLDRHERSAAGTRVTASVDNDGFASVDQRDAFDEELATLEQIGGLDLIRRGSKSERTVTGARLKDAAVLYAHLRRQPAAEHVNRLLSELRQCLRSSDSLADLIDEAAAAWSRGVSFAGIPPNDVRTLEQVIGLARAIQARMAEQPSGEVDFRTFSRLAVVDSKALERNLRQVSSVVFRLSEVDQNQAGLDPEEFLGSIGIRRLPQPILVGGPILIDGAPLPHLPFVGIPTEYAGQITLAHKPSHMMTIENYTSFVRYAREVGEPGKDLVIYTGGFPSRPTLETIARLAADADVPTFHWGDMDAGGVRIFRHIERKLELSGVKLRPHMMEVDLLLSAGSKVPDASRVTGDMTDSAIADLARVIRETGLVHEQEEFRPQRPELRCSASALHEDSAEQSHSRC